MKEPILHQRIKLTCLGPVHIGSGNVLNKGQYIYDFKQRRAYFLDEGAWIRYLGGRGLLDRLIGALDKSGANHFDLFRWCTENRMGPGDLERVAAGWAHVPQYHDRDTRHLNAVSVLIRGADGKPYIPGSSIKGALRTAILHKLLKEAPPEQRQSYWREVRQLPQSPNPKVLADKSKSLIFRIETDLLHRLTLMNDKGQKVDKNDAVTSALKGLRVSDAVLANPVPTLLVRKVDWRDVHPAKDPEKLLPLFRECFAPGTVLTFTLSIETAILGVLGFDSVADVLKAAQEFTADVLTLEKSVYGQRLNKWFDQYAEAGLVLGGGAGFLDKTLLYSLAPRDEVRQVVAALLDRQFTKFDKQKRQRVSMHRHVALDTKLSPRTLKIGYHHSVRHRMGLCKIEEAPC